jgi:ribosome-binding factor A
MPDLDGTGLDSASGFVRRRVAKVLALRKMPALRFRYDPSMKWAGETMELLDAIKDDEKTP